MTGEEFSLAEVFRDAKKHQEVAGIISEYLQNKDDIRSMALNDLELSESKNILDLGCGFGFFTQALKGRVHPDAKITGIDRYPEYEWFYFQSGQPVFMDCFLFVENLPQKFKRGHGVNNYGTKQHHVLSGPGCRH